MDKHFLLQARDEIKTIIDAQEKPNIPEVILDFRTSMDKAVRGGLISDTFSLWPRFSVISHPLFDFPWKMRVTRSNQNKFLKEIGLYIFTHNVGTLFCCYVFG